jgi:hypothetical protein
MQIGDGATGTITNPNKQGGLVAIYYLGTLLGALMYVFGTPLLECSNWQQQGRMGLRQDRTKQDHHLCLVLGSLWIVAASGCSEFRLDALCSNPRWSGHGGNQRRHPRLEFRARRP